MNLRRRSVLLGLLTALAFGWPRRAGRGRTIIANGWVLKESDL